MSIPGKVFLKDSQKITVEVDVTIKSRNKVKDVKIKIEFDYCIASTMNFDSIVKTAQNMAESTLGCLGKVEIKKIEIHQVLY